MLSLEQTRFLDFQRVARLATVDGSGMPHVVPVCYALDGDAIHVVLDEKPKRVEPRALKRVRNILENPNAALVVDHYDDQNWSQLGWIMLRGRAEIVEPGPEQAMAIALLRARYSQYRSMHLEECPMITLRIERVADWGVLGH
jgi:coenzyme F420-0:L-glutamate ligase/coenzyme F420-1:gamma-L-glutamate ligase